MKSKFFGSLYGGMIGFFVGAGTGIVGGVFGLVAGVIVFTIIGVVWGWSAGPDLVQAFQRWRGRLQPGADLHAARDELLVSAQSEPTQR